MTLRAKGDESTNEPPRPAYSYYFVSQLLFFFLFQLYPLWLCPFWLPANPGFVNPKGDKATIFIDIGAYGAPKTTGYKAIDSSRRLEKFVRDHSGQVIFVALTSSAF